MTLTQFYMGLAMQALTANEGTEKLFNGNVIALHDIATIARQLGELTTMQARLVRFMDLDAELSKLEAIEVARKDDRYAAYVDTAAREGYLRALRHVRELTTNSIIPR